MIRFTLFGFIETKIIGSADTGVVDAVSIDRDSRKPKLIVAILIFSVLATVKVYDKTVCDFFHYYL